MTSCVKGCRTPAVAGSVPRSWSAGVGQASEEETAGGLGSAVRTVRYLERLVNEMRSVYDGNIVIGRDLMDIPLKIRYPHKID